MMIFSNKMSPLMFASAIISLLNVFVQGNYREALIFDRFSDSLFKLPDDIPQDAKCGAWAVACPAETSEEKAFINEYSFTKNALFVKEIHHKNSKVSEMKKICEEPVKLSIIFHTRSLTHQFGFEFYYKLADAQYFHEHSINDYRPFSWNTGSSLRSTATKALFQKYEYNTTAISSFGSNIKELWFDKDRKMGFLWISMVQFVYDSSNKMVKKMAYRISTNSRWPADRERCEDFSLGKKNHENIDVFYSEITQNIFDHLKLTWTKSAPCESNRECFKKVLLIPMDQFRFGNSPAVCSNLATIPVWAKTQTEHFLRKVDQYLYAIHKVMEEPLHILTGVYGEHKYPKRKGWGKSTIYLDSNTNKMSIPKVIYKIVEYRLKNYEVEERWCWYSAIIFIHNDPFFKLSDKICSSDVTEDWGWSELIAGENSEMVYVCPKDMLVLKKLFGLKMMLDYQGPAMALQLNLKKFPFSSDGVNIKFKSIVTDIGNMLKELSNGKENFNHESEKITELPADTPNLEETALLLGDGPNTGPTQGGDGESGTTSQ